MRRASKRIRGKSTVVPSPFGDIEYAEGGTGPAVLVVHGSGGGFDERPSTNRPKSSTPC